MWFNDCFLVLISQKLLEKNILILVGIRKKKKNLYKSGIQVFQLITASFLFVDKLLDQSSLLLKFLLCVNICHQSSRCVSPSFLLPHVIFYEEFSAIKGQNHLKRATNSGFKSLIKINNFELNFFFLYNFLSLLF